MPVPINTVKDQVDFQLDLLLRLAQINHCCTERVIARQLASTREVIEKLAASGSGIGRSPEHWLLASGNSWMEYWKLCLCDGLEYQHQILAELSKKK